MTRQALSHLDAVNRDIARAREELRFLRERRAATREALEDRRLRMLIAETPIADRDLHVVADELGRVEGRIRALESDLAALTADEARLAGRGGHHVG
jgi:chromosome segregation ATPase